MCFLKAYAAELAGIQHLTRQLVTTRASSQEHDSDDNKDDDNRGNHQPNERHQYNDILTEGSIHEYNLPPVLVTDNLSHEVKAIEAVIFNMLKKKLYERKQIIHSAILEDGLVDESSMVIGPWLELLHLLRFHIDVDVNDTIKNMAIFLLIAKFGAYGELERGIINKLALGYLIAQTRYARLISKVLFSFAASNRERYIFDLE